MKIENNNLEIRKGKGNGITLIIDNNSNYGLSKFIPISESHYRYKLYQKYKQLLDNDKGYCFTSMVTGQTLTREETEAFIRCLGCKTEKINNFKRYCSNCEHFIDFYKKL